jgi:hypothetical protein
VANAMETIGQYMQHKATHELVGVEFHRFMHVITFAPVVFVCEANVLLIHTLQSAIGNGNAMSSNYVDYKKPVSLLQLNHTDWPFRA